MHRSNKKSGFILILFLSFSLIDPLLAGKDKEKELLEEHSNHTHSIKSPRERGIEDLVSLGKQFSPLSEIAELLIECLKHLPAFIIGPTLQPIKSDALITPQLNQISKVKNKLEKRFNRISPHVGPKDLRVLAAKGALPLKGIKSQTREGMRFIDWGIDWNFRYTSLFHDLPNPLPAPKPKDKIAIVGAGPAGLHMAYLLKEGRFKKRFKKITIFEKSDRPAGKSYTLEKDDGVPQEMGTCYTVFHKYDELRRITKDNLDFKEVPVPPRRIYKNFFNKEKKPMSQEDYILSIILDSQIFKIKALARIQLFVDMLKYEALHFWIFSYQKDEIIRKTKKTFKQFLKENNLLSLVPLFTLANTIQGYGFLDKIPAYYGLWWNSPGEINSFIVAGLDPTGKRQPASLLRHGFENVFRELSKKLEEQGVHFKYDFDIKSITRDNTVSIKGLHKGSPEQHQFDFLILTTNLKDSLDYLEDATEREKRIFEAISNQSNLITTLYLSDV